MKANELRIGNLLYYKNTVDVAMVEIIHKKHFDCRDKYGTFTPNGRYEPIPLTEEWLLKFGFGQMRNKFYKKHVTLTKSEGFYVAFVQDELKSVHQLQNLFFSLCGEELSVK